MKINTGDLIHVIREDLLTDKQKKLGRWAAQHLAGVSKGLRIALGAASVAHAVIGDKGVNAVGKGLHKLGMPLWTSSLPVPFSPTKTVSAMAEPQALKVVYYPSCINRAMGRSEESDSKIEPLVEVFVKLCNKAGYEVIFPKNLKGLCCGMIWESKGMPDVADEKLSELENALIEASEHGRWPVVCDQSPCLHRMTEHIKTMKLYERRIHS